MNRPDFDHLIRQLSRKLYGFAFRILRSREEAEDAVQEIFIKLWKMREKLDEYKSIEALATTLTRNHCIDMIRRQKHNYTLEIDISRFREMTSPSPYDLMENSESNEIVFNIIECLPEAYKAIIRLRDIEGLSYEEIAEKTNISINTLRVTLSRARRLIRDEYNKNQYEQRGIKQVDRKVL